MKKYISILFLLLVSLMLVSCGGASKKAVINQQAFAKVSFIFDDTDSDVGEIQGNLYLKNMPDLNMVDEVIVYWSSDGKAKEQELYRVKYLDRKDLLYTIPENTTLTANYLVVYLKSQNKTYFTGINLKIKDRVGSMENTVTSLQGEEKQRTDLKLVGGDTYIVYFNYDDAQVLKDNQAAIETEYESLTNKDEYHFKVEGHADERGSNEYNLALGARRAFNVKKLLVQVGFLSKNIKVVSYGEEKPAVQGHSEKYWKMNRRAVIVTLKKPQLSDDSKLSSK